MKAHKIRWKRYKTGEYLVSPPRSLSIQPKTHQEQDAEDKHRTLNTAPHRVLLVGYTSISTDYIVHMPAPETVTCLACHRRQLCRRWHQNRRHLHRDGGLAWRLVSARRCPSSTHLLLLPLAGHLIVVARKPCQNDACELVNDH